MRACLVVLTLLAASAVARAEVAAPSVGRHTLTLGMIGGGGHLAGLDLGGFGPNLEVALGSGRWQYFTEGGAMIVSLGGPGVDTGGYQVRGGLGARWIARSLQFDHSAAVEMTLEGFTAVSEYWWTGGGRLLRPEVGVGVGWQVRFLDNLRYATRMTIRIAFGPDDPQRAMTACKGACPSRAATGSNSSIGVLMGFQW